MRNGDENPSIASARNGISRSPPRRFGRSSPIPRASTNCPARHATGSKSAPMHRAASTVWPAEAGPLRLRWEEGYGEWQENRRISQTRDFLNGPLRRSIRRSNSIPKARHPAGIFGARSSASACWAGWPGCPGRSTARRDKRLATIEQLIAKAERIRQHSRRRARRAVKPAARRRFEALIAELDRDPASHGLGAKACRLSAPRADGGSAAHPPAGDGAINGTPRRRKPWKCSSPRSGSASW